jgi:hypothetical protein
MMNIRFAFLLLILTSCDYFLDQKVIVLDKKRMIPIQSAKVKISSHLLTSDSTGFCHFAVVTGDLSKRTIEVSKEGFIPFSLKIEDKEGYMSYRQKIDSTYTPENSFAVMTDTLVVYLEKDQK